MILVVIQQIINGLALGSVYALIALGYTMVYGIIGLINFAHGDVYMAGAFIGFYVCTALHLSFVPTLLIAMAASAALGILIEKAAYRPLRKSPKIALLITAIGVSLFLENAVRFIAGPNPKPYPAAILPQKNISFGALQINNLQLIILCISVVLALLLQFVVYKTKVGKAMRAAALDKDAAVLMGINIDNIISITFAIGSALAGAAGVLVGILYNRIDPLMGVMPGLKAFIAAVLGGIGIIPGAIFGGLFMGIAETLTKAYISSKLSDAIAFGILILVLIIKPSGLLGRKSSEKV